MYDSTYHANVIFTCYSNLLHKLYLIIFFANRNFMGSHWQTTQSTWHLRALFWAGQVDFWVSCFASGSMTCTPSLSTSDALPQEDAAQSKLQVIHTSAILTMMQTSSHMLFTESQSEHFIKTALRCVKIFWRLSSIAHQHLGFCTFLIWDTQ